MSTEQAIHTKGLCKSFGKNECIRKSTTGIDYQKIAVIRL